MMKTKIEPATLSDVASAYALYSYSVLDVETNFHFREYEEIRLGPRPSQHHNKLEHAIGYRVIRLGPRKIGIPLVHFMSSASLAQSTSQ